MDSTPSVSPFETFVERSGPDAEARLRSLATRLREASIDARLLRSREEADLWLLRIDGDPALAASERDGARVWRFEDGSVEEAPS